MKKKVHVHHITPGASDKNLGKAINILIEKLPEDDWICVRDIDTLPLHHREFFKQCEEIAERNEFGLVGAMTNRLGLKYQLHGGEISENYDMKHHINIAVERFDEYGSEVDESHFLIAGMFMLFSKKVWQEVGGFPEGRIQIRGKFIDWLFSKAVEKAGYKIGIAKGIYLFHIYREWVTNVRTKYNHLL